MRSDFKSFTRGGPLIEEGGLTKSEKQYKRGHFLVRGGSYESKILEEGSIFAIPALFESLRGIGDG